MKWAGTWILLSLLACSQSALAHNRGTSYSQWTIDGQQASVRVHVSQLELTRLQLHPQQTPEYARRVGRLLSTNVQLWAGNTRCRPSQVLVTPLDDGWLDAGWTLSCSESGALTVRSKLFLSVAPGHLHMAKLEQDGAPPVEKVLTYSEPFFTVEEASTTAESVVEYVQLGVEHILSGWDHLCFVLALILLAPRLREVALIVTGFTVAHSLTLAAAVLGWVSAPTAAIEALIGYSIVVVAAENLWLRSGYGAWVPGVLVAALLGLAVTGATTLPLSVLLGLALFTGCYFALAQGSDRPLRLRASVTFLFGLVHGFGFAGVMLPLDLPADRLMAGLLGFNIGVELGQLLFIAVAWPLLKLLERAPSMRWAGDSTSAVVCALGTFWFVSRAFT